MMLQGFNFPKKSPRIIENPAGMVFQNVLDFSNSWRLKFIEY